jgi:hypothetical protein
MMQSPSRCLSCFWPQPPRKPAPPQPLALTHVTIIDTTGGPPQPDMTVVIRDGRIASIEKSASAAVPKGAQVVDARGKFLIPGLWDMHVHLSWTTASALPALVANGVTGVRDMGGRLSELDDWRTKIAAGLLVGPRIVRAGPILNGKKFNPADGGRQPRRSSRRGSHPQGSGRGFHQGSSPRAARLLFRADR